jgi:hypothetical protein
MVALSGKVSWVKLKYGSTGKLQLHFTVQQPYARSEVGTVVSKGHISYFCTCFKGAENYQGTVKEGSYVAVQGKLQTIPSSDKNNPLVIIVEKIDVYGPAED